MKKLAIAILVLATIILAITLTTSSNKNTENSADITIQETSDLVTEQPKLIKDTIVNWGEYEFAGINGRETGYHLYRKNLNTNKIDYLVPVEDERSGVSSLYLYGDSLYLVVSGYLSYSQFFYLENPESEPIDITDEDITPIGLEIIDNRLYLVEEFGDFCIYNANYYRIDGIRDYEFVANSYIACDERYSSYIVGFWDEWIVYSDTDYIEEVSDRTSTTENSKFTNLYLINLYDTDNRIDLITTMPATIDHLSIENNIVTLRSANEEEWTYNLTTKNLDKL